MIEIGTGLQNLPRTQGQAGFFADSASLVAGNIKAEGANAPASPVKPVDTAITLSAETSQSTITATIQNGQTSAEKSDSQQQEKDRQNAPRAPQQASKPDGEPLSESEQQLVEELKKRDAEVRAHEQAHRAAGGSLIRGNINFSYENGPDGKRYAVGGDVKIDTSEVPGDPRATLIKAQKVKRAANAPVEPSATDRAVAAEAARMEAKARQEISQQARENQQQYIEENKPEVDFFGPEINRIEKDIQDTYKRIQNASFLEEPRIFVDVFI
jgi:hypothetical protein